MALLSSIKKVIQSSLNALGWEVHRYYLSDVKQLCGFLEQQSIDLVLDVGANTGQFGIQLFKTGYKGKLISFEPLTSAHVKLSEIAKGYENWSVAPRAAVGSHPSESIINISANSVSSSLLQIREEHTKTTPSSRYVGTEATNVICLDDYFGDLSAPRVFLKIDTQGFEYEVLKGASYLLEHAVKGVQAEFSLSPLYDGQADYLEMLIWLRERGFYPWALSSELTDPQTSRLLQANIILFRN